MNRAIIHVDMDAFFASVEQLDHPEYRGKPVIVGADPQGGQGRGVVAASSYEARKFGVRSAMPISRAYRLCPQGIFVAPRGGRYGEISQRVFAIFRDFSDLVEPLSVDEAFIDATGSLRLFGSAEKIGREIKRRIKDELGLVASVGIAPTKFVAKIASDIGKPNGFVMISEEEVLGFLHPLPITRLWGVGEKTAELLSRRGIKTIGDVAKIGEKALAAMLGDHGAHLWRLSMGIDEREVVPETAAKSVGNETTFDEDTADPQIIRETLLRLCDKVAGRLRKYGFLALGVTLKFRDEDFRTVTRSLTRETPTAVTSDLYADALALLSRTGWTGGKRIRLVGITAHRLATGGEARAQGNLFVSAEREEKKKSAECAVDAVRQRFGKGALLRASLLKTKKRES